MDLKDFQKVADHALRDIENILKGWYPKGQIIGREFCIGNAYGAAGTSLRVRLRGEEDGKAGYWSDFADGEAGRDLISLYALKEGVTQGRACAALAKEFGIELTPSENWIAKRGSAAPDPKNPPKPAPAQAGIGVEEKKRRTKWEPITPVPARAGAYPVAHLTRGRPEAHWEYLDEVGQLLGVVYRFKTSDGGKEVLPCVYAKNTETGAEEWHWIQWLEPRPLYRAGLPMPLLPVLLVEGEKCADAAHDLVGDSFQVMSWPGGGNAVQKADWHMLVGRHVLLWPDCDSKVYKERHARAGQIMDEHEQPGMKAMIKIAELLKPLGCQIEFIDIPQPGEVPDGWDVADLIASKDDAAAAQAAVMLWINRRKPLITARELVDEVPAVAETAPVDSTDNDESAPPSWVTETPADDVPESASTPRPADAGQLNRREIRMLMIPTGNGGVKGCRENVYTALQRDVSLQGLVALDLFSMTIVKRRNPPWPSEPGEWNEGDDFQLGMYTANAYGLVMASVAEIEKAVAQIARDNAWNPVTEMLDECKAEWDGQPRVREAFATYWGAEASEYLTCVSRMFFVGLVKRAYCPGVKHDDAPVFEGGQGEGKSTALSVLGGEWFADTPFRMGEKDGFLSIQGIWLYEIAELEQFNRSEVTAVKAFMSSQKDRYREPYGRRMKNQLRRTCFAATTNEDAYFKDMTGNRRFWPVHTGLIALDLLRADLRQLFGEAVHLMEAGEKWFPTRDEQQRLISPVQESREIPDDWTGRVYRYLEGIDEDGSPSGMRKTRITSFELLTKCIGFEVHKLSQAKSETMRMANIMRKLGWKKKRESTGAREQYFVRPAPEAVVPVDMQAMDEEDGVELPF